MHYYNEIDAECCAWLRELMDMGCIPDGEIDQRPIQDVSPDDLAGYRKCHFFAGIGVWAYALRQAGWPEKREVWTGSCPCQPFSAAGKRGSHEDERHLWPHFFRLIKEHRPEFVLGEQVASKDGLAWIDAVHADLEAEGYSVGEVDICAAGFGGPHIRQRLYFAGVLGDSEMSDWWSRERRTEEGTRTDRERRGRFASSSPTRILADCEQQGLEGYGECKSQGGRIEDSIWTETRSITPHGPLNGFWSDAVWIPCRDGKWRPTGPGISPLVVAESTIKRKNKLQHSYSRQLFEAHRENRLPLQYRRDSGSYSERRNNGQQPVKRFSESVAPGIAGGVGHSSSESISEAEANQTAEARVMRLKGYGNALCAETAIEFVKAFMDVSRALRER